MFQSNTRIVIVVMGHLVVWATYLLTSPRCAPNLCHCPTVHHHHRPPNPNPHPHLLCAPNLCHCSAVHHHHGYTVPAIIIAISFIMMSTTIKIIIIIITVVVIFILTPSLRPPSCALQLKLELWEWLLQNRIFYPKTDVNKMHALYNQQEWRSVLAWKPDLGKIDKHENCPAQDTDLG